MHLSVVGRRRTRMPAQTFFLTTSSRLLMHETGQTSFLIDEDGTSFSMRIDPVKTEEWFVGSRGQGGRG